MLEQSELFGYCLWWWSGCGNIAEAVEDIGLCAQGLGLPLASELVGLKREVSGAENERYAASLVKKESVGSFLGVSAGTIMGKVAYKTGGEAHDGGKSRFARACNEELGLRRFFRGCRDQYRCRKRLEKT